MQIARVLVVYKKSPYQLYVKEKGDDSLQRAIDCGDPVAQRMIHSHEVQQRAVEKVQRALEARGIEIVSRWRGRIRTTRNFDLVLSVGGDGTLLETAHWLRDCPLLGINSDPASSVGRLCAGPADEIDGILDAVLADELQPVAHTRIQVRVDGQAVLGPALNDLLFAHRSPADMSRFQLAVMPRGKAASELDLASSDLQWQEVRSSGIWISTGTGATAAMRSAGGDEMSPISPRLQYLVRERYAPPDGPRAERLHGFLEADQTLVLVSRMRSAHVWADGPHRRARLRYGQIVCVESSATPLLLVGSS